MDVDELIRRAARKVAADPEAAALFECLRPHFLNSSHDVGSMYRACNASRSARRRLVVILGPLKTWVTKLRMTEAARQVRETPDKDEIIGQRLGYLAVRGFRRAFERFHDVTPHEMRLQAQAPAPSLESAETADEAGEPAGEAGKPAGEAGEAGRRSVPPAHRRLETPRARALRRRRLAALGLLDPVAAAELRAEVRRRHPGLDRENASPSPRRDPGAGPRHPAADAQQLPVLLTPTGDHLEEVVADTVFDRILELPDDEQRFALLEGVRLTHPAPFLDLCNRCMRMAAEDGDRAVATAELVVRMIGAHREMMGDAAGYWQAVAWVRLGRVQAHLGDGSGAERSLAAARAELGSGEWDSGVEMEVRRVEAMVRKLERRFEEAVAALDRAVHLARRRPRGDLDRWQILFQRLELAAAMGDAEAGLEEAS